MIQLPRSIGNPTIAARFWHVAGVAAAGLLAISATSLHVLEDRLMVERKAKVRAAVELAHTQLAHYGALADAGKMDREDARRAAMQAVRAMRYDEREYLWINDLKPTMIMHPIKPEMDGQDLSGVADPVGNKLFVGFVDVVRVSPGGGGFYEYLWPKVGATQPVRKLSYVKLYQPWGWVVGSGVYLDDVEAAISTETKRLGGATAFIALILCGAGMLVARPVKRTVLALNQQARKLETAVSDGRLSERADPSAVGLEFRSIVDGMNATMDAFARPMRLTADYVRRISKGDIPPKISEEYRGDFNEIKDSFNRCIDTVNTLVADTDMLVKAAIEGQLSKRADADRLQGHFARIVQGVNGTLDAVVAPIQEAAQVLERLAQRDLRARAKGDYRGDHARIKDSLNSTAEALHQAMSQVAEASEQVSDAAGQIASTSQQVADGASRQASAMEETGSSLESMASMTKLSSANAEQARALALTARAAAQDGTTAMAQMTNAMGKIRASAEGTSQIIKDINEVAFQTNLLALNAAVEAARAGDAGRGFAVVAEEVRALAMRSKEAAGKTEELIRQSVKEASEGEATSKRVSDKLAEIAQMVGKTSDIVTEIASTVKEQASGIEQVSKAVADIGNVTQQNAASSEETSSAAAELSSHSEELASMVGSFRLERATSNPGLTAPAVLKQSRARPRELTSSRT
jgi:methyl-accepting chemotaxis protein